MSSNSDYEDNNEILREVEDSIQTTQDAVGGYKILTFSEHVPDQYKSFVYSRWLHSLRYGNEYFKLINSDTYYAVYSKIIDVLISRAKTEVKIAVLSEDQDVALGWSVCIVDTVHYVYVKPEVRKQGIAAALVPEDIKKISHVTKIGLSIWNNKLPRVQFNPFN